MTTSKACCTVPPVVTEGYTVKGTWAEYAGLKTYVTGNKNAKVAILSLYDIFSFYPQTQQGADILAAAGDYLVVMPDFFKGDAIAPNVIPPDTDEKMAALQAFFKGPADLGEAQKNARQVVAEVKAEYPNINKWGAIGYCWGGKVAILLSGSSPLFSASAQAHPALMEVSDAQNLTVPHMILASADESADSVSQLEEAIKNNKNGDVSSKSVVETYGTMIHGWMSARAHLDKEDVVKEYARGYKQVADFFASIL